MTSQRINAAIRDALVQRAVDRRFEAEDKKWQSLVDRRDEMREIYNDLAYKEAFSPEQHKILAKIPKGWLTDSLSVRVQISGEKVEELEFGSHKPVPYKFRNFNSVTRIIEKDNPALAARKLFSEAKKELIEFNNELSIQKSRLKVKVRAVIESVTTTGKLLEIWPECKELLPPQSMSAGNMLPAINLADLNKELGL